MIRLNSFVVYFVVKFNSFENLIIATAKYHFRSINKIVEFTNCVMNHEMIEKLKSSFVFIMQMTTRVMFINEFHEYIFEFVDQNIRYLIEQLQRMRRY